MWNITSGEAKLNIDAQGHVCQLDFQDRPLQQGSPHALWTAEVQQPSTANALGRSQRVTSTHTPPPKITADTNRCQIEYATLGTAEDQLDIAMTLEIVARDSGGFGVRATIDNRTADHTVTSLQLPILDGVAPSAWCDPALLWPNEAGQRFTDFEHPALQGAAMHYPGNASMRWFALAGSDGGLYFGSHDASLQSMYLNAHFNRNVQTFQFAFTQKPFVYPGEHWVSPWAIIQPYRGRWHTAADIYRHWAQTTWWQPAEAPKWLKQANGFQLSILKQQNGETFCTYDELQQLIELSDETGMNVLGLFGWTEAGHDRHYPIYEADPAMGGTEALRGALQEARRRGKYPLLYYNGQLMDTQTSFFHEHGHALATVDPRGDYRLEYWRKYAKGAGRAHVYACASLTAWREHMIRFCEQAQSLGAVGVVLDQIGNPRPDMCFGQNHGHDRPSLATGPAVAANLQAVQDHMQRIDPEFVICTEHVVDQIVQQVDFVHGSGFAFAPVSGGFTQLLRYTFPELQLTQRQKAPVLDRHAANFGCFFGLLPEIEMRYEPDYRYALHGESVDARDYLNISPGERSRYDLMDDSERDAAFGYMRLIAAFRASNADLLCHGKFIDQRGLTVGNPALQAVGYLQDNLLGVLLWNTTDQPQQPSFSLESDWQLVRCTEPGCDNMKSNAPIAAQTLRLYRYESTTSKAND